MKKYLIIGGAGFIGSHVSEALLKEGASVAVIDSAPFKFTKITRGKIRAYKINADDGKKITNVFKKEKPDVIFHLAGGINLRRAITDPLFLRDVSFLPRMSIILDACRKSNVKKVIFVSSGGAVYENSKMIPTPEEYPVHPESLYGLANLMIERYMQVYCKSHGLDFTIPRLGNVYGPGQWHSGFVPSIVEKFLKQERPVIYGTGNQTRDFVYIDDAVKALILLAKKGGSEIYNVGSGKETSLNKVFSMTKQLLGEKIKPMYKNSGVPGTQRSAVDIKKIQKELKWRPKTPLEEGLKRTIERLNGR